MYFWLGQKGELAAENYPFDVIDSVYYLNIVSDKAKEQLGYNSMEPGGYFNFDTVLNNIQILAHVNK